MRRGCPLVNQIEHTTVVKFEDGKYLGTFGKVETVFDAIKFNGDWVREVSLNNQPITLINGDYEVINIRVKTVIQFLD